MRTWDAQALRRRSRLCPHPADRPLRVAASPSGRHTDHGGDLRRPRELGHTADGSGAGMPGAVVNKTSARWLISQAPHKCTHSDGGALPAVSADTSLPGPALLVTLWASVSPSAQQWGRLHDHPLALQGCRMDWFTNTRTCFWPPPPNTGALGSKNSKSSPRGHDASPIAAFAQRTGVS